MIKRDLNDVWRDFTNEKNIDKKKVKAPTVEKTLIT